MIDVLIIAPGTALRAGLRALLESDTEVQVVAEATRLADLPEHLPAVDVILLAGEAFGHPELAELLAEAEPAPAALWLTSSPPPLNELAGLPLRAWGLMPEEASAEELLAAIHSLNQGLVTATLALLQPLLGASPSGTGTAEALIEDLTPRELDVLALLADGLANKQMARALEISEHTVKFHIASIYAKLGVNNRAEAVRAAARLGLITL